MYDEDVGYTEEGTLDEEYEASFTSEEKIANALKVSKDEFTIDVGVVDFESLLVPDPIKKSRKETYLGLSTSIAEMGILQPIHVMVTEGYADWVAEHDESEEAYEGYKYVLLDGFRRVWGGYKNGLTRANAIIWDFKDKDRGSDLALVLSRILNKTQKGSWSEIWYLYQIFESQSALTPGTLEYLLQLNPGDAMKLKDIMSCDYDEVKTDLLNNKKTIDQAYSALQKLRKEEDQLVLDDNRGVADMEQAEGIIDKAGDQKLSDEDIKQILEMDDADLELREDDFDESLNPEYEVQDVGDRHSLDPAIKAETMIRDGYKCVCCGDGEFLPMRYKMSILQSHHKISVANGGPDSPENVITLCMVCHSVVHCLIWSGLKFNMSKEDYEALPESEKTRLQMIRKIAKKDWDAGIKLGKKPRDIQDENKHYSQFKMPGTDMRQNKAALIEYNKRKQQEGIEEE